MYTGVCKIEFPTSISLYLGNDTRHSDFKFGRNTHRRIAISDVGTLAVRIDCSSGLPMCRPSAKGLTPILGRLVWLFQFSLMNRTAIVEVTQDRATVTLGIAKLIANILVSF